MGKESHIVRHREDGTNDIVLRDSQVRDMGIELWSITAFMTRKRAVMCYPRADIDFIKDRLEVARGSRGVIIYVKEYSIIYREGNVI